MFEELSTIEKEELIISLATLTLADSKVEITKENLNKLVKESGNMIAAYWSAIFASNCADKDVLNVLAAPGVGAVLVAGGSVPSAHEVNVVVQEEEEEEEEEVDMSGGGLFGGDEEEDW